MAVARWTVREMRALASSGLQKYREPPAASSEAWQPRLPVGSRSTAPGVSLFTAEIGPALPLRRDDGKQAALEDGADHIARYLDTVLRRHPGDWLFWDGFEPGGLLPEEP